MRRRRLVVVVEGDSLGWEEGRVQRRLSKQQEVVVYLVLEELHHSRSKQQEVEVDYSAEALHRSRSKLQEVVVYSAEELHHNRSKQEEVAYSAV